MFFFEKFAKFTNKKEKKYENPEVQTAIRRKKNDFSEIGCRGGVNEIGGKMFSRFEADLYRHLKESIPVIDAAISKITRLIGNFEIECASETVTAKINNFLKSVKSGPCGIGIENFISSYFNQLLTYGTAIGEIVTDGFDVYALYNVSLKDVELRTDKNSFKFLIFRKDAGGNLIPIKRPEFIFVSALNPEPGKIYGNSILKGLPFISGILLKIFSAIGNNWERMGDVRFAVTYKPPPYASDYVFVRERATQIASEWSRAMEPGSSSDFVAIGDVDIKAIGADNQILDSRIPVRQILEQIISKLSIPPFLLGFSWSTTETMASQQTEILSIELAAYRRNLNPVINKICKTWMRCHGFESEFEIIWRSVNLKDELKSANVRLINAKAARIERLFFNSTGKI
ncbi:MAG: phage portal protein [Oscillospiraceae bacterium]|jgi:hypothetical protein|nr:phage portal protein [Oscillospiraceae bacterium]